jgi:hypothetical protein
LQVGVGFAAQVEWHLAMHVRHHLGQVSHVDQRAADIAVCSISGRSGFSASVPVYRDRYDAADEKSAEIV